MWLQAGIDSQEQMVGIRIVLQVLHTPLGIPSVDIVYIIGSVGADGMGSLSPQRLKERLPTGCIIARSTW